MPHLFPRLLHDDLPGGLFAVPLDGAEPPRPRALPPVCIVACADRVWVGSHLSRVAFAQAVADGCFGYGTVARIGGSLYRVVRRGQPTNWRGVSGRVWVWRWAAVRA